MANKTRCANCGKEHGCNCTTVVASNGRRVCKKCKPAYEGKLKMNK